jgi:predicted NUDIX family NTP pyrophosphohydrolase
MHIPKRLPVTLGSTSAFEVRTYFAETAEYAVAQSTSDAIGITWNPDPTERPNGFPHSYNHQQWFILPEPIATMLLSGATLFDGQ